jgi:hypothetical protein
LPPLPIDRKVELALASRIMHDTGVDGHTARAMVADVRERGADSPHAQVVSAAAHTVFDPVVEAFNKAFGQWAEQVQSAAAVLATAMDGWMRVLAKWGAEVGRHLAPAARGAYAELEAARKQKEH